MADIDEDIVTFSNRIEIHSTQDHLKNRIS